MDVTGLSTARQVGYMSICPPVEGVDRSHLEAFKVKKQTRTGKVKGRSTLNSNRHAKSYQVIGHEDYDVE